MSAAEPMGYPAYMDERVLSLLCDPETLESLGLQGKALVNAKSGKQYPIREGIPDFLTTVSGQNKRFQELYDRIAFLYDPLVTLTGWIKRQDFRTGYVRELEVPACECLVGGRLYCLTFRKP